MGNVPPNATGQVPRSFVDVVSKFGRAVNASFAKPLIEDTDVTLACGADSSKPTSVVLNFTALGKSGPKLFDTLVTQEDISTGQRIESYALDMFVRGQQPSTGWQVIPAHGKTVGNKVVDALPFSMPTLPILVEAVR